MRQFSLQKIPAWQMFSSPTFMKLILKLLVCFQFNLHEKEFRRSLVDSAEKYSKENNFISENVKIG